MSLFKRLFGGPVDLAALRKHAARERWADLLHGAAEIDAETLTAEERSELEALRSQAGDRLAALNLEEAEALLRAGEVERAREHARLAAGQAGSPALQARARELQEIQRSEPQVREPDSAAGGCSSGCGDACAPAVDTGAAVPVASDLDLETRLELCLGGYPDDLVQRYLRHSGPFVEAVVQAHEGADGALPAFSAVGDEDRDDLFYLERGTLYGRLGEVEAALGDLRRALDINPGNSLAGEALASLLLESGDLDGLEALLAGMQAGGYPEPFWRALRAGLEFHRGHPEEARCQGRLAWEQGNRDSELVLLLAGLAEQAGDLEEAEHLLSSLPAGGCGGSAPLPLADFWLRHRRHPEKALETFKAAWRQEPGNPLWPLKTAQAYLVKGWTQEGRRLLEQVAALPDLPKNVRQQTEKSLSGLD